MVLNEPIIIENYIIFVIKKHKFEFLVRSTQRCEWLTVIQFAGSAMFYPGVNFINTSKTVLYTHKRLGKAHYNLSTTHR